MRMIRNKINSITIWMKVMVADVDNVTECLPKHLLLQAFFACVSLRMLANLIPKMR